MDRLFHRHALRHLDMDLIDRIASSGPQGHAHVKPKAKSAKTPRPGFTYRQNGRGSAASVDPCAASKDVFIDRPFRGDVMLNRSSHWKHAATYQAARDASPSSQPVR
jgi:hypothetical protein